jgi:hypothetical protein
VLVRRIKLNISYYRITELELALLGQMPIPDREGTKVPPVSASPGQKRKHAETGEEKDEEPGETDSAKQEIEDKKPKLKRSKAKISLSELTDDAKAEVKAAVRRTAVLGDRKADNKDLKQISKMKSEGKKAVLAAKPEKIQLTKIFEDKENEAPVATKRARQVKRAAPVVLEDSYVQTDDAEDSDEVGSGVKMDGKSTRTRLLML